MDDLFDIVVILSGVLLGFLLSRRIPKEQEKPKHYDYKVVFVERMNPLQWSMMLGDEDKKGFELVAVFEDSTGSPAAALRYVVLRREKN